MNTDEVAARLVEMWRRGDFENAQESLPATQVAGIENYAKPAFEKETKYSGAILEKGKQRQDRMPEYAA